MAQVQVSLICTVYNEQSSIRELLDSLLSQSRLPDEIVIVDGGSTDRTADIVSAYVKDYSFVTILVKPGVNIAQGRNMAIDRARFDVIASIDGGCWADKHWLRNLTKPFEEGLDVDVVSGFFVPDTRTKFEACLSELIYPRLEMLNSEHFLPSGRSIAFRKECWQMVGGYPERLSIGEDSLFDLKLKDAGFKFIFARDAIVHWRPRSTLRGLYKQYYLYAKGAAEANIVLRTITRAYGGSVIAHILKVVGHLIARGKVRCLGYTSVFLSVILVAKAAGLFSGKIGRFKKGNRAWDLMNMASLPGNAGGR